jgi:hypothetical protein
MNRGGAHPERAPVRGVHRVLTPARTDQATRFRMQDACLISTVSRDLDSFALINNCAGADVACMPAKHTLTTGRGPFSLQKIRESLTVSNQLATGRGLPVGQAGDVEAGLSITAIKP